MTDHHEPTGVTIHDPRTDTLRDEREWTVLDKGQFRTLRLRVGRGVLDPPERDDGPRAA